MEQNQRMDWGNCGCICLVKIKLIHDDSEKLKLTYIMLEKYNLLKNTVAEKLSWFMMIVKKLKLTLHHVTKIQFADAT